MSMKLTIIAIILSTALACSSSNCQTCTSKIVNLTITEICTYCKTNYLVNSDGGCSMNLTKLISMVFIGLLLIALSLVIRWILIEINSKKKPVYTADYQNKIYQFMNERKSLQQPSATYASQRSQRNLLMNLQILESRLCGICKKDIAHGDKVIDTITSCKHHFHALCLKSSMNEQLFNDPHNLSTCPQCRQTLYEMKIYCQKCKARSRNVLMEDKYSLCKINSFTCFRCSNEKRWQIKEGREKQCCGMGKYLYCYCIRDF